MSNGDKVKNAFGVNAMLMIIIFLVLAGSLLWIYYLKQSPTDSISAVVRTDNQEILNISLSTTEDTTISLSPYGREITLEIKDHAIRFLHSDCPDKVCVNAGFLKYDMQTAICMPNKVSINLEQVNH